jgi:hypothetical protein
MARGALPPPPQDLSLCCLSRSGFLPVSEKGIPWHPLRSVEATESALGLLPSMALSSAQLAVIIATACREMHSSEETLKYGILPWGKKITLARITFSP